MSVDVQRVNIDIPKWNQSTYMGRLKYFFVITNPLNILKSDEKLRTSKDIVDQYR